MVCCQINNFQKNKLMFLVGAYLPAEMGILFMVP